MALVLEFDPDGPAHGGLFGLPHSVDEAAVVVCPVPFDATTSFGGGTAGAPDAVLEASHQVDLCDPETGDPWRAGLCMDAVAPWIAALSADAREAAVASRQVDPGPERDALLARVNAASRRVTAHVRQWTTTQLEAGRIPAIVGGDHSVPLGAFAAALQRNPGMGFLHIDAHADLRDAYEGFEQSHASIFHNALELPDIGPVVQVGIRDFGMAERARWMSDPRVHTWTDTAIATHLGDGEGFGVLARRMVAALPETVWVSFDIDGLDPSLCPGTGTPVPGGLSWREAMLLLSVLGRSGRRIVGFDLCEVGISPWDANVGARTLYKLAGWSIATRREV